ncbi:hypothetical protein [Streptomyces sp. NPDC020597]|uniref:hypothetical protein n=1 Tax=unclassified Streptomyces TaxID=2593676 RepID=UPI0037BAD944
MNGVDVRGRVGARAADLLDRAGAVGVQLSSTASEVRRRVRERADRPGRAGEGRASRANALVASARMPPRRAAHTPHAPRIPHTARTARAAQTGVRSALRRPRSAVLAGAAAVTLVAAGAVGRSRVRR